MSDRDDERPVERGPRWRDRSATDEVPQPRLRQTTAPLESIDARGEAPDGWRALGASAARSRGETAELLPLEVGVDLAAPLAIDDGIEADDASERTIGFDEATSTLDDLDRSALQAAVARSLEAEHVSLGEILRAGAAEPTGTVDFDESVAHRYRDVPVLGGPEATADFGDSLDASLDRAIDEVPLKEDPTDVDFPKPETRPLGGMTPPEWAAHVLTACRSLAAAHRDERTFGGRFDLDEDGVVGSAYPAEAGTDGFVLDVRRMHHLVGVIAEAVRAGGDNSPTSMVVADALTEVKPAETANGLVRGLLRALASRTARQHKRLTAEFEAVEARKRALASQRRLRADLAARMARLDASISAQAAAVARDEDRVQMLGTERTSLDGLIELTGVDPAALEDGAAREIYESRDDEVDSNPRSVDEQRSDKVRRLLGA